MSKDVPRVVEDVVLKKTVDASYLKDIVLGYDWSKGLNYGELLKSYLHTGFQATNFGLAVKEINKMIECRNGPEESKCAIFLGYTSNIVSSGLRETIRFLVQNKMV